MYNARDLIFEFLEGNHEMDQLLIDFVDMLKDIVGSTKKYKSNFSKEQ